MAEVAFAYAVLRVVPRVERGERVNAGVVLFCRQRDFLALRLGLDDAKVLALDPEADLVALRDHLDALVAVADGDPARGGPLAELPQSERFGWLVAPSSTVIQPGAVHTGVCDDPQAALDGLLARYLG